ncbi:Putative membrane protein ydgH [Legionella donaldsonii]|uniref:Membrane protein ydgH n=1 Tax=Legionella donaldsonii TaxID=45060 RepID=A0A378IZG7_9GAMM|nr:MMPL family transporter [Legionella donaldsonii]STX40649.1 Putative membrane protein ydgH [Legionella donaldsonii]
MMKKHLFYKLGSKIYPLRWYLIILWVIIILACVPLLIHIVAPFKTTGFKDENSQSAKTQEYIDKKLGYDSANKFLIIYQSKTLRADQSLFNKKINQSLSGLENFPIKHDIFLPSDNKHQISKDKHSAYVVVIVKSQEPLNANTLAKFTAAIKKPSNMTIEMGGQAIFVREINKETQHDLYKADFIATPVAIITLLVVFGSLTAALLPILLGGGCALIILTALYILGESWTLSVYTLNIALLLGLCLSLDYSLFIISRFREELHNGIDVSEAIAITAETAGKAIFFSGLAVLISISALFLFPINILFSMAVGGIVAVVVAVITAVIVLPAFLAVLKNKINLFSIHLPGRKKEHSSPAWRWLAEKVVAHPLYFFFPILILLLLLGYPFLSAKFGVSDYRITPKESESRQFFNTYEEEFDVKSLTPILLLVQSPHHYILSQDSLSKIYTLVQKLKDHPSIDEISGVVSSDGKLTKKQYINLYSTPKKFLAANIKKLLATTTGYSFAVLNVSSNYQSNDAQTIQLVKTLRNTQVSSGLTMEITGTPAINVDVLNRISQILPWALLWIMVFTYLILLLLLRSLFIPIKAILMNLLSLSACYGALVLVFQDGYLAKYLNFEPQGMLDISLLVIIFCALFGFSMDYEVFLLSRIKEAYEKNGHHNNKSIISGIERSSRIITSAALIVIFICGSFLVADVLMVKAFGLGIAVAIFVDAFLIRTLLVPSTMVLLKEWNWYLPRWLDRILPKL